VWPQFIETFIPFLSFCPICHQSSQCQFHSHLSSVARFRSFAIARLVQPRVSHLPVPSISFFRHCSSREPVKNVTITRLMTLDAAHLNAPPLSSKWKFVIFTYILQGKKTTLESNAITLIVCIATRHPRTARSCGSTHGTPTQWIPMTCQFNKKTLMKQNEQAPPNSKRQAPAPPMETTGMHARLSLTNHKCSGATYPMPGKSPPQFRKL
jgi:hypothetical protein